MFDNLVHRVLVPRWFLGGGRFRHTYFFQDQRADIFQLAEGEITRMLSENLLHGFRGSPPYKELINDEKLQEE